MKEFERMNEMKMFINHGIKQEISCLSPYQCFRRSRGDRPTVENWKL